jgi:hypothetical protein
MAREIAKPVQESLKFTLAVIGTSFENGTLTEGRNTGRPMGTRHKEPVGCEYTRRWGKFHKYHLYTTTWADLLVNSRAKALINILRMLTKHWYLQSQSYLTQLH